MANTPDMELPPGLAARPLDPRRKLPIPMVNEKPDGAADFLSINGPLAMKLATQSRCGTCGQRIAGLAVFLGGPNSAQARVFTDPPMCEDCANAAVQLCPHIAREHAKRASASRVPEGTTVPDGWSGDKPKVWVMALTTGYYVGLVPAADGGMTPAFFSAPFERVRRFSYVDGVLVEQSEATARQ